MRIDQTCCNELSRWLSPKLFRALGDPTRVALLARLGESRKEQTVTELSEGFPTDLSDVSRHLGILRDAGILESNKRGKRVFYRIRINALSHVLHSLADALDACCPENPREEGSASAP